MGIYCDELPWFSRPRSLLNSATGEWSTHQDHWFGGTLAAPSQLGREERHGGILKENFKHFVKVHKIIGKKGMKMASSTAIESKNEMMREGGIAPCQCVIGTFPRGVGHLLEEEEE